MNDSTVSGRAWRFGSDVDTDIIVPSQYMRLKPEEYATHVMEPEDPTFADRVEEGDVMVAEHNFGIGSSREHAAIGLKLAGVGAIVAASFGRIFYRNAINQGLPAIRADTETIERIDDGDELEVRVFKGVIENAAKGETYETEVPTGLLRDILEAGGAKRYYADS